MRPPLNSSVLSVLAPPCLPLPRCPQLFFCPPTPLSALHPFARVARSLPALRARVASRQLLCSAHLHDGKPPRQAGRRASALARPPGRARSGAMGTKQKTRHRADVDEVMAGPYRLCGRSVAAVETCMWVPSASLAVDAGKSPAGAVPMRFMALTHGHCDHVHGLPLHAATRGLQGLEPAVYFVPGAIADDVRSLIDAVSRLERASIAARVVPLSPGDEPVHLSGKRYLGAFATKHTVPSQGYVLYERRKRLLDKYRGCAPQEIAQARKHGEQIDAVYLSPEIAFTGDTTIDAIADSPDVRNATVLVTEMTFLDHQRSPDTAHSLGHIHLEHVRANAHLFAHNSTVVFSHFSARYSPADIRAALASLPRDLRRKSVALGVGSAPDSEDGDDDDDEGEERSEKANET